MKLRRRSSMGSIPSRSASLSSVHLEGEAGLHAAVAALGPHAGLLVKTRVESKRYAGISYGAVRSCPL
jgi:hypothetical protein